MRYFYHADSDCLFTVHDDDTTPIEPDCIELEQDEYYEMFHEKAKEQMEKFQ